MIVGNTVEDHLVLRVAYGRVVRQAELVRLQELIANLIERSADCAF